MYGDDVRPVRVVWSVKDGERSVGLGGLHTLLAQDPALGLAVLRGLKEWEHGRQCSKLGPLRPYKPCQWAHLGQVGWLQCEDAGLWWAMGGRVAKEVKEEREGASTTTTPLQAEATPQETQGGQSPHRKEEEAVRVRLGRRVRQPRLFLFVLLRQGRPAPE